MWVVNSLFMTITNANFDDDVIIKEIEKGQSCRETLEAKAKELGIEVPCKISSEFKIYW